MEARSFPSRLLLCAFLALALAACTKFGRLSDSEKVATVTVGAGGGAHGRSALSTPQTGGIMVWAENSVGDQAAFYLASETATYQLNLTFGTWAFHAVGWDGGSPFVGNARCGSTTVGVDSSTTDVTISIGLPGCATDSFLGASPVRQLQLVTCNLIGTSFNGDTNCNGSAAVGNLQSFRVLANTYNETVGNSSSLNAPATSSCIILSPPPPSGSVVNTGLRVPEGAGAGSPIDVTIQGFTDTACTAGETDFRFNYGLAAASGNTFFANNGTSLNANLNVVFLQSGPAYVSGATSGKNPLRGGFPLTVNGGGFDSKTKVYVGGVACPITTVTTASLTCTAPAAYDTRAVNVDVYNVSGAVATTTFTYADDGFGNNIDADTVGATVTVSSSILDTSNTADTAMTTVFGGRPFQSFRNISSVSGTSVVSRTAISSTEFKVHDDVIWHVSARSAGTTDCDSSNMLTLGKFGFARVTAVDYTTSTITLDQTISASPNNTGIGNATRTNASIFCDIQLVRVPNFDNLTIDSTSAAIGISPPAFNLTNGYGGILAIKTTGTLNLTGTHNIAFDASSKGHPGGADGGGVGMGLQGEGQKGSGTPATTPNTDGGGGANSSMGAGGGGGVVGAGGGGALNTGAGGAAGSGVDAYNFVAALGAGGGGAFSSGSPGGPGGGIVLLYAYTINGTPVTNLIANGGPGSAAFGDGGGGGSAGTTYVQVEAGTGGASVVSNVVGGTGGSGTYGGGGGGGGMHSSNYCTGLNPGITPTETGGAPGSGGTAGGAGTAASHSNASGAAFCP